MNYHSQDISNKVSFNKMTSWNQAAQPWTFQTINAIALLRSFTTTYAEIRYACNLYGEISNMHFTDENGKKPICEKDKKGVRKKSMLGMPNRCKVRKVGLLLQAAIHWSNPLLSPGTHCFWKDWGRVKSRAMAFTHDQKTSRKFHRRIMSFIFGESVSYNLVLKLIKKNVWCSHLPVLARNQGITTYGRHGYGPGHRWFIITMETSDQRPLAAVTWRMTKKESYWQVHVISPVKVTWRSNISHYLEILPLPRRWLPQIAVNVGLQKMWCSEFHEVHEDISIDRLLLN